MAIGLVALRTSRSHGMAGCAATAQKTRQDSLDEPCNGERREVGAAAQPLCASTLSHPINGWACTAKRIARDQIDSGRRISAETIETCVCWYITYRLSYRDLVALRAIAGVVLAHG